MSTSALDVFLQIEEDRCEYISTKYALKSVEHAAYAIASAAELDASGTARHLAAMTACGSASAVARLAREELRDTRTRGAESRWEDDGGAT